MLGLRWVHVTVVRVASVLNRVCGFCFVSRLIVDDHSAMEQPKAFVDRLLN